MTTKGHCDRHQTPQFGCLYCSLTELHEEIVKGRAAVKSPILHAASMAELRKYLRPEGGTYVEFWNGSFEVAQAEWDRRVAAGVDPEKPFPYPEES